MSSRYRRHAQCVPGTRGVEGYGPPRATRCPGRSREDAQGTRSRPEAHRLYLVGKHLINRLSRGDSHGRSSDSTKPWP
jgi:hypothetical protein